MGNSNGSLDNNPQALLEEAMMQELRNLHSPSSSCSIYRVPQRLRSVDEKAYRPKIVSIGPFHHGKEELQAMEEHKMRYLHHLVNKTRVGLGSYIKVVMQNERKLRDCYDETIRFTSNEFVKIILVDAAFIIGFLLRQDDGEMREENDRIFGKPWLSEDIYLDMLMLENQLPFFILKVVFQHGVLLSDDNDGHQVTIFDLSCYFFKQMLRLEVEEPKLTRIRDGGVKHFVDFLRHLYLPLNEQQGDELQSVTTPNITELHQAGVKFKVGSSNNLFDLQFRNGCLEIPKFLISKETKILIRNLLAFEQCYYKDNRVNDYVVIMTRLVNTEQDVDLVVKDRIIENRLGDSKEGSFLIKELADGVIIDFEKFYFAGLCNELNNYCKNPWHNWMANLKQKYFNTPWAIIAFIAGVIILTLTIIQTGCSIISIKS